MDSFLPFLPANQDLSLAYTGLYDPVLVSVSVLTAVFASFMALQMAGRIARTTSILGKFMWLVPGALAMGGGVWAMHFIGMLAFSLPCGISYDPLITMASMFPGILASAVALWVISHDRVSTGALILGGVLMGGGIGTMHYSGMAAMRLDAVLYYAPAPFFMSIAFAIALAILALYSKFVVQAPSNSLSNLSLSLLGAVIMGAAISGMHYIAMEAAYFIPNGQGAADTPGISPSVLAIGIGTVSITMVAFALVAAVVGRYLETIATLKHEILERQRAQSQLSKLSRAVEQSSAGVLITDLDGVIEYVNPKFTTMTGYSAEEAIGQRPNILKSGHMSDDDYALLWQTITSGQEWRGEMRNKRKDGSLYWDFSSISTVRDTDGTPINFLGIKEDITETKAAMEALQLAKEDAEYANHVKSQFLASMSHELRTPLNAIIGFSQMIMTELFGPLGSHKYMEYLRDIHDSGAHLLELITDILDMSKIESGTMELHEVDVEISYLADSCRKLVQKRAQDKNITLTADLPSPSPVLRGDSVRIKQILINLLTNAVKYTPEGGDIAILCSISADGGLDLTVVDTGIGMAPDDIPRALEPFAQFSDIMTNPREGVGLGLYLTRNLVETHGGSLSITSQLGQGTTVTAHFPASRVVHLA
ncbi:MAG TPA: MHYT domain-containing protein [Magnetovibrio sp.]